MPDQVQEIFSYLRAQHFHFPERWVIEGIEYYRSNDPNISFQKLRDEVHNQWLLANLRDFNVPSLPPNLSRHDKITLPGKYVVQVETMLDASKSCYSQLQELQKVSLENIEATKNPGEWNVKANRCLIFTLCDGVQEIKGMEYFPINKIRTHDPELLPGFKMLIFGPVQCRKGMILLKEENVKILGGEVDVLCETNNLKSLLCKKLNIEDSDEQSEGNNVDYIDNGIESRLNENERPNSNQAGNRSENVSTVSGRMNEDPMATEEEDISNLLSQNDELFQSLSFEADFDQVDVPMKVEPCENVQIKLEPFESVPIKVEPVESEPKPSEPKKIKLSTDKKPVQSTITSYLSQSVRIDNEKLEKNKFPVKVNHNPFVYLKQIINSQVKNPAIFTVKAVILTIQKKMGIKDYGFAMSAIITDGSAAIEVAFSSDVLENLMGYSPDEFIQLHREKLKNSAIADRLKKMNIDMSQKLIDLCCLMDIQFFNDDNLPIVLRIEDVKIEHLNALNARRLN